MMRYLLAGFIVLITYTASAQDHARQAQELLDQAEVRGGLIVQLGCGDGQLTAALLANDRYQVQAFDKDERNVLAARNCLKERGIYGKAAVDRLRSDRLPFVDNFVNLIVTSKLDDTTRAEVMRVLVPGGIAMVGGQEGWERIEKPRTDRIDEWTHFLHSSSNNPVADDEVVGPPKHLQWLCGPAWSKHHEKYPPTIPLLVSSDGRLFYFEEETPPCVFNVATRWTLKARDAFNGTLLWTRSMPEWEPLMWPGDKGGGLSGGPIDYRRRMVAVGDRLYVTLGYASPVTALNAATGETVQQYDGTGSTSTEIAYADDSLFISQKADRASDYRIARFDPESGRKLWEAAGGVGMAVDDGRVLFIDRDKVGSLNAKTGESQWLASPLGNDDTQSGAKRGKKPQFRLQGPLRTGEGIVLACPGTRGGVIAMSVEDGSVLWQFQNRAFRPFFRPVTAWIVNGLVWVTDEGDSSGEVQDDYVALGLDPKTGEERRRVPCGAVWNCGHHQRCYPSKATSKYLIFSRRGAEFLNLANGEVGLNNWTRGSCGYGVMPANGLLYAPPHSCRCYSEAALRGLCALAPADRGPEMNAVESDVSRLLHGHGYGFVESDNSSNKPTTEDWPTYRHDAARSGAADTVVASDAKPRWQTEIGGRITPAVVAGGRVYVAAIDAHTVYALNEESGEVQWTFTAGGRIDTPPTIHGEAALFGSADGWVYCLLVNDGSMVWRFRAAPQDLRMGNEGQVESIWPVHGSVLVRDEVAYCAAGRGSFVDGGIWVYGLAVKDGLKLYECRLEGPDTGAGHTRENPGRGFVMPGSLPDILVADEQAIYMRHMAFDPELKQAVDMEPNLYPAPVRAGEEFGGDHKFWCDLLEVGPRAFVGRPDWDHRSYFNKFPGQRLYSTTGLLDDSWHIRSYWSYGQIVGQFLVFRGDCGYAVQAYPNAARWASYQAGDGYVLYSGKTAVPKSDEPLYALRYDHRDWQVRLPFRPTAMVLAGETLFLAGPPDTPDPKEALAALSGEQGAVLHAVSTDNGKSQRKWDLASLPVFDGITAARGRLFIAKQDGRLTCFE